MTSKIFLIGLPGSGKTTLGKELSQKLGIPFEDTDEIICRKEKKSIEHIFEESGEKYFRELEKKVIRELLQDKERSIVSTGGGLPCFYDNMEQINEHGLSIFLNVPPETITHRLWAQKHENRPMLKGKTKESLRDFLIEKLKERIPFYSKAKITFEGNSISSESILKKLKEGNYFL
jgi:shikimate kinase